MPVDFSFSGKSVLIVEDQKPFQVMLKGMLSNMGAEHVTLASNGEQAVARCNETQYDILFIDYNLGSGRNGRQLYEELKHRKLIPIHNVSIIVTGESLSTMVVGALEIDPDDYIVKPFSQNLLKQRVKHCWEKKQALCELLSCLDKKDYSGALNEANSIINKQPRQKAVALKYKCEILYRQRQFDVLATLLDQIIKVKRLGWSLIMRSKIFYENAETTKAIAYAKEAINQNRFNIEAYDIITDCYLDERNLEGAYEWIRSGIDKSPFSVPRQYKLSIVAKLNKDFEASIKACAQVVDLTSTSFKRDYRHLLNHVRNIIDICELEQDARKIKKYNQEAIYALEQSKRDLPSHTKALRDDFEKLCVARLDSANGYNYKAKKSFFEFNNKYHNKGKNLPTELLGDSISLMLNIGEFEKAKEMSEQIKSHRIKLDDFSAFMLEQKQQQAEENIEKVNLLNNMGIEAFKTKKYHKAFNLFEKALELAPMNTGSALNQIQVIVEMAKTEPNERWKYVEKGKHVYRIVQDMPLSESHEKRAVELAEKLDELEKMDKNNVGQKKTSSW